MRDGIVLSHKKGKMKMVQGLKMLFSKIQDSPLHPAIKYPALILIAAGIGACVVYGVV